jgi:hypothetical protein
MHPSLWPLFSARRKIHWGLVPRPHYAYCIYYAASLARILNIPRISVVELGVAGGNGLVVAEQHAHWIQQEIGVEIEIYGFDSGEGLPEPEDYRDLQFAWRAGFFRMDREALQKRLKISKLVLGNVRETTATFFDQFNPAPIGCIFHDLDFYSSTRDSLKLLEAPSERLMPRIYNYFDDIIGSDLGLQSDYVGQRLAIREFNEAHAERKIANCYQFAHRRRQRRWYQQIFAFHDFRHPQYNQFIETSNMQLPLPSKVPRT